MWPYVHIFFIFANTFAMAYLAGRADGRALKQPWNVHLTGVIAIAANIACLLKFVV